MKESTEESTEEPEEEFTAALCGVALGGGVLDLVQGKQGHDDSRRSLAGHIHCYLHNFNPLRPRYH